VVARLEVTILCDGGYIHESMKGDEHEDKSQCKIMLCERPLCPHLFGKPNN
jgi:hypothetical protein